MNKPMILKWQEEKKPSQTSGGFSIITSVQADDMNSYEQDVGGSRKHQKI